MISSYSARKGVNAIGTGLTIAAVAVAVVPLGAMLIYVLSQGGTSLNLDFFVHLPVPTGDTGGGMANAIAGTLMLIGIAASIGLPLGIVGGIYLAQARARTFPRVVRFVTDVVAGTPSIVAGVVAYALIVIPMGGF